MAGYLLSHTKACGSCKCKRGAVSKGKIDPAMPRELKVFAAYVSEKHDMVSTELHGLLLF